ncbi:thioredoxin TRX1 [Sugiyamaella lignohabitans]|uniref:Thioredoxin n=1 Tax=Sugiyamaella lignohabitans TaxID=796027 RepID=A0A167EUJ2_9ASCO|nr:thioredoxin TRX1 [Sugiyamaella lignohabitans]ANB14475.1 thioredoxin TRX1 [Sugiyamaella lignohabitans]
MTVNPITSLSQFQEEIKFSGLTVIDFYATWCGPCKMISPVLDRISDATPSAHFFKVDVDAVPDVASENEISAMPTLLFFKNGVKVESVVGANIAKINAVVKDLA